jgi:CHAD domain-containing protein
MVRAQRQALAAHELGTRQGTDPEELHQMRTAVRRLRAILRAVRPALEPGLAPLGRELRWLGAGLGKARDLDVLRAYLGTELGSLTTSEAAATRRVLRQLDGERTRAGAAVRATLASARYTRLRRRLDEALRRRQLTNGDLSVARIARRQFKKLRKAVRGLPKAPTDDQLHAVRVRIKRARYAAELARAKVGRPAKRFINKAGQLQDILGEHQDAVVAEVRLSALLKATGAAHAAGRRLVERQRRRRRTAWADFQDQWPKLERRGLKAWE